MAFPLGPYNLRTAPVDGYTRAQAAPAVFHVGTLPYLARFSWINRVIHAHTRAHRRARPPTIAPDQFVRRLLPYRPGPQVPNTPIPIREAQGTRLQIAFAMALLPAIRHAYNYIVAVPIPAVPPAGFVHIRGLCDTIYKNLHCNRPRSRATFMVVLHGARLNNPLPVWGGFANAAASSFLTVLLSHDGLTQQQEIDYVTGHLILQLNTWRETNSAKRVLKAAPQLAMTGATVHQPLFANHDTFLHHIRGGGHADLMMLGLMSPDRDIRYDFRRLQKWLKARGLVLSSPKTRANCLWQALFLALRQQTFASLDARDRKALQNKATRLKTRVASDQSLQDWALQVSELEAFRRKNVCITDHALNTLAHIGGSGAPPVHYVVVFGEHAYAAVPPGRTALDETILIPRPLIFADQQVVVGYYDIETTQTPTPYAVGLYLQGEYTSHWGFGCLGQMLQAAFYASPLQGALLYAHNGGKFDSLFIEHAVRRSEEYRVSDLVEKSGRFLSVEITQRTSGKRVVLRDTYPFLRAKLSKLTSDFHVEHLKGDVNHAIITDETWEAEAQRQNVANYLMHDVLGLSEVLAKWRQLMVAQFDLDPVARNVLTSPGISKQLFLREYDPTKWPLYQLPQHLNKRLKKAFHGGLCQVFKRCHSAETWRLVDVVSMYPSVLVGRPIPFGAPEKVRFAAGQDVSSFYGLMQIEVVGGNSFMNAFYIKDPTRGLLDPQFDTPTKLWVWSTEYHFAVANNDFFGYTRITPLRGYAFASGPWLRDLTLRLFELKTRATKGTQEYELIKERLNSLWGHFVIRQMTKTIQIISRARDLPTLVQTGHVEQYQDGMAYGTFPIKSNVRYFPVGCATTSEARTRLMAMIIGLKKQGAQVAYCDTDSILTDASVDQIRRVSPIGRDLGQLDVEFVADEIVILAPKLKAMRNATQTKLTAKGLDLSRLAFDDFVNCYNGEPIEQEQLRFLGGKGRVFQGTGIELQHPIISVSGDYRKGHIGADGVRLAFHAEKVEGEWILT